MKLAEAIEIIESQATNHRAAAAPIVRKVRSVDHAHNLSKPMKTSEAIEIIEAQAVARYAGDTPAERGMSKIKEWCKSVTGLDKSISTGYSLVGNFCDKKEELEPGLFLLFTLFSGRRAEVKGFFKRNEETLEPLKDENGLFIRETKEIMTYFEEARAILFDFDGKHSQLEYCAWDLPRKNWAKQLWWSIEQWLEIQPNIPNKIDFWEREVELRSNALRQAQQRLDALKRQIATDNEKLDPQTKEWLQTAAVLGTKKATEKESLGN
jgi:hypothetical protein